MYFRYFHAENLLEKLSKPWYSKASGKRAGAVERAALEMRYIRKGIGGSNPSPAEISEANEEGSD